MAERISIRDLKFSIKVINLVI